MSQINLWEKAAECTRAIEATSDPTKREMLVHLQTLWVNLANESQVLSESDFTGQIEALSGIHLDLIQPCSSEVDARK
jgi:hypothetical protein